MKFDKIIKLYMSLLPPKVLRIMEWIGFSGDSQDALKKMNECADSNTLRSLIAMMTPWTYYYIFQFQFGAVGEKEGIDIKKVRIGLKWHSYSLQWAPCVAATSTSVRTKARSRARQI